MRDTLFLPPSPCPNCGKLLNGAGHPGNGTPAPGDATICLYCGELCEFGLDLRLQPLSDLSKVDRNELEAARQEMAKVKATGRSASGLRIAGL